MRPRKVYPDGDDTKGLPLFAGISGCDATVPAVLKLEGGPAAPLHSMPISPAEADRLRRGEFAPWSNPTTSHAAAEDIKPKLGDLEDLVLEAIRTSRDGLTCDEIEEFTRLSHQCASARVRGLVLKGLVKDSTRTRKTRSGRNAIVWSVA